VSHRISAVRSADRILVLENGSIAASGTHGDLIRRGGYYETTFRYQEIDETDYGR
jgi:ATP-binding cassette subfamily B protein